MTYFLEDIMKFIIDKTGCTKEDVNDESDLVNDLGCSGDDFHELIDEYAKKFNVDMTSYLWYFHGDEEGQNIGALFFKPPYKRVKHIPLTPSILLACANQGKWTVIYPEHKLPKRRYDILINVLLILVYITVILYKC